MTFGEKTPKLIFHFCRVDGVAQIAKIRSVQIYIVPEKEYSFCSKATTQISNQ